MKYGTSFLYLRDAQNRPTTVVLISTQEGSNTVAYSYCTVNPKDRHKYSNKLARTICEGRMNKGVNDALTYGGLPDKFITIAVDVLTSIEQDETAGPLTREMCEMWLNRKDGEAHGGQSEALPDLPVAHDIDREHPGKDFVISTVDHTDGELEARVNTRFGDLVTKIPGKVELTEA